MLFYLRSKASDFNHFILAHYTHNNKSKKNETTQRLDFNNFHLRLASERDTGTIKIFIEFR